ncbi:hypothetical protein H8K52_06785 [Undibacterium seohonense]|uniref:Uncharacterized protein n=1 Tax=Undibacterium seohonense TaxID=1344950 RepID=A0ABR6X258_9BURK|nr:hypothetical protein [Undibacterium seohonense]MBC3807048.1 hypothetical protein [Undibacterium seohonense]
MNEALTKHLKISQLPASFWVENDSRSVIAMVRGAGDGRHLIYLTFLLISRYVESPPSMEQTMSRYADVLQSSQRLQKFNTDRRHLGPLVFLHYGFVLLFIVLKGKKK